MYVCICNGLTEREVAQAIGCQANSVAKVYQHFDARPQCGKCVPDVREALRSSGRLQGPNEG